MKSNKRWMSILIMGILTLLSNSVLAQADNPTKGHGYFGGGIARVGYDWATQNSVNPEKVKTESVYFRAGWQFNDHVSLEARVGLGGDTTGDGTVLNTPIEIDYELKYFLGAYARVGLWASDSFYPYLIGGFTRAKARAKLEAVGREISVSESDSDFSYGLGTDIVTSEQWRINLEYMKYYDKDDTEYNALAIGFVKTF